MRWNYVMSHGLPQRKWREILCFGMDYGVQRGYGLWVQIWQERTWCNEKAMGYLEVWGVTTTGYMRGDCTYRCIVYHAATPRRTINKDTKSACFATPGIGCHFGLQLSW